NAAPTEDASTAPPPVASQSAALHPAPAAAPPARPPPLQAPDTVCPAVAGVQPPIFNNSRLRSELRLAIGDSRWGEFPSVPATTYMYDPRPDVRRDYTPAVRPAAGDLDGDNRDELVILTEGNDLVAYVPADDTYRVVARGFGPGAGLAVGDLYGTG